MSDLQDFIAGLDGVHLHRKRKLTVFSHVQNGPLIDMLYNITRPPLRVANVKVAKHRSHAIIRKGMVNYRREMSTRFGDQSE